MAGAIDYAGSNFAREHGPDVLVRLGRRIRKEVANNVRDAGNSKHILNVGHGVVQGTPEGNVGVFCDAARASVYADIEAQLVKSC